MRPKKIEITPYSYELLKEPKTYQEYSTQSSKKEILILKDIRTKILKSTNVLEHSEVESEASKYFLEGNIRNLKNCVGMIDSLIRAHKSKKKII